MRQDELLLRTNTPVLNVENARGIGDQRRLVVQLTLGIEGEAVGIGVTHHGEDNCP